MIKPTIRTCILSVAATASLGSAGAAYTAGFNLLEQNVSGLGNAYAGSAAVAENASTIYFNPAGMTYLPGGHFSVGVAAIKPSFRFRNHASTGAYGSPATGGDGGDAGKWGIVPNMYLSWELTPRWFIGLGVGAPFGLTTDYREGWIGRHHSEEFAIESININPSVAYKVNERLSLGFGVNWMHLDADYRLATPIAHPALGYLGDAGTRVKMSGDGWGWNAGLMVQITPDTRIGLSYRSRVKIDADGSTRLHNRNIPGPFQPLDWDAGASIKLPDTAILSLSHQLNTRWQLLADISWTGWSSIPRLSISNSGPGAQDRELDLRFKDSWRVALGTNYHLNAQWTLKGGVAWDQSPVQDAHYRPTSLPDNDRYWVSIGAQYRMNKNATFDVGYTHLFLERTRIHNDSAPENGVVHGKYKNSGDIVGVQFSYQF